MAHCQVGQFAHHLRLHAESHSNLATGLSIYILTRLQKTGDRRRQNENAKDGCLGLNEEFALGHRWNRFSSNARRVHLLDGIDGLVSVHEHKIVTPADLKWEEVPALPKGAKAAVIEGPMNQAVPFTARIKFPADFKIPAHSHPGVERATIISGTLNMGFGDKFDKAKTTPMTPGSIMIMQPNTNHFAWTETDTIVQLNGTGPWDIVYVNPEDDPRKK